MIGKQHKEVIKILTLSILSALSIASSISLIKEFSSLSGIEQLDEHAIWEDAFKIAENNKVGIEFNPISTTKADFDRLYSACNSYINQSDIGFDTKVAVDTVITEEQFIDGKVEDINKSISNTERMASAESASEMTNAWKIYLQDMLMVGYINDLGELKVVIGKFNSDKTDIEILHQGSLIADRVSELDLYTSEVDRISEEEYLENIVYVFRSLLENSDEQRLAYKYFTIACKEMIELSSGLLGQSDRDISFNIVAGKSDLNKTYKDRLYLQIDIDGRNTNLILKLNSNLRVFDIDYI